MPNAHDHICTTTAQYCEEGVDYGLENSSESIDIDTAKESDKTEL